jgi:hypothetical protein
MNLALFYPVRDLCIFFGGGVEDVSKKERLEFMLFFQTKKEKEEIQDKIDDIDMAIYRRRCDLESAQEKFNQEGIEHAQKKIEELEIKRRKLSRKIHH